MKPDKWEGWINLAMLEEGQAKFNKKFITTIPFSEGVNDVNLPILIEKIFDVLDQSSIRVKP
ncbi:hypothetical protein L195_g012289 [Trifolium pratense]|uniref:Uncharacterized protein n=1 Tax=Trifolium pratense TaxID=57577 RepID=A0A2K3PJY4_TRIPR|nr:hypothetical protein L195_g012289 [Trifolium pratense]